MLSFLRFNRGKRDQKRRRSTTSWSPTLESLEELILLSPTPRGILPPTRHITRPSVNLVIPQNRSTVYTNPTSSTLTLTANASDTQSGVASVQFFVNGRSIGKTTTAPYFISWNTKNISGLRTFKVVARDGAGHVTTSAPVVVKFVLDKTPPSVTLNPPPPSVSGEQPLTAVARDTKGGGIASVQFLLDGYKSLGIATTAPYTIWWNTTQESPGPHSITAVARDVAGNVRTSAVMSTTVLDTPPTVSLASLASSVSGTQILTANASDTQSGIASVQFLLDGQPLATVTAAPYTFSWNTTSVSPIQHTLTAIAQDGAGKTAASAPVKVTVLDTTPPTVSLASLASSVSGTQILTANASDTQSGIASVQFLLDGQPLATVTAAPYTFSWNTTSVSPIQHTLTAIAKDGAGKTAASAPVTVTVLDTTPPTVSLASLASSVSGTQILTANASDTQSGIASVQFLLDGQPLATVTAAPYTFSWNTTSVSPSQHTLTAIAADGAGKTAASAPVTVTVLDTTPPTVSLASLPSSVSGTQILTANASDTQSGIASVQFLLDGQPLATVTAAPYTFSWNTTSVSPSQHTLTAIATDGAGRTATSAPVTVTVLDTTPPTVSLASLASSVSGTQILTANASDTQSGIASVQFLVDGQPLATVTAAPYTFSWNTTSVSNSQHALTAIATDGAGNTATSAPVTVTVLDTTPPTVSLASLASSVSGTQILTANASDTQSGIASVQFLLDGQPLATVTAAPYTFSWNTTSVSNSQHTLTAIATDGAGNTATSATVTVTVLDTTPPTVSLASPGSSVSGTQILTANASDTQSGIASVQFLLDGQPLATVTAAPYTFSWNTTSVSNSQHTLTAIATDGAGNTATTATVTVTVLDTTPPTVSLASPGSSVSGTQILTANASDTQSGIASVQFLLDGQPLATVTAAPYTFSWDTTSVSNSQHTLTAIAKDGAGNTATTAPVTVTVLDTTPPTVSLASLPSSVSGTQILTANASDTQSGIASVQFLLDGQPLATVTAAPYTFSWDTTSVSNSQHTLTAIAKDGAGNTATSAPVTVTVANTVVTPTEIPVISFHGIDTSPANFPYDMPLSTFTADMTALHNAGYHSITLQQYLDWEAGKNPVLPSKPILLTDDDGDATIQQMTSVLQSDGYTMVAFIVTGFIDNGDTYYVNWTELQSMVASGTWEVAFHAGADGHYDYSASPPLGQQIEPNAPDFYADYFTANNGGVLETDAQYQARVTTELDQGMARLKQMIPTAYTNVFAVPFNDYGEYAQDAKPWTQQQDLTTIFDARFTIVFVEDNDFPNSVDNNNHQYRFEVHNDTSTSDLLAALNDPAFTRFGLPVALTATQVVVTTQPPASVTAGGTFSLTVTAEDDAGNVDTTYNGPVMLYLNGSNATATLGDAPVGEDAGNIVDAINGVATFTGLTINTAGTHYTISAFAVDLPGYGETNPITVT